MADSGAALGSCAGELRWGAALGCEDFVLSDDGVSSAVSPLGAGESKLFESLDS
jgi:hypothetical protein